MPAASEYVFAAAPLRLPSYSFGKDVYRRIGVEKGIGEKAAEVPSDPVAPYLHHVGPCLFEQYGDAPAVLGSEARLVVDADRLADLHAVDDDGHSEVLARSPLDLFDHLDEQAGAVLQAASVNVFPLVPEGRRRSCERDGCSPH